MKFIHILVLVFIIPQDMIVDAGNCIVPDIMGEMFKEHGRNLSLNIKTSGFRYIKVDVGTVMPTLSFVTLICHEGYVIKDTGEKSARVTCSERGWNTNPLCVKDNTEENKASCILDMPSPQENDTHSKSCTIPAIKNGEVGTFKTTDDSLYHQHLSFITLRVGDTVNHEEKVYLICEEKFITYQGELTRKTATMCCDGVWTKTFQCLPTSCFGDPPNVENAHPEESDRNHGVVLQYRCNIGYKQVKEGSIICEFGKWEGELPECRKLNKEPCLEDPPAAPFADLEIGNRSHGGGVWYKCHDGYIPKESGWYVCDHGEWKGRPPKCIQINEVHRTIGASNHEHNEEWENGERGQWGPGQNEFFYLPYRHPNSETKIGDTKIGDTKQMQAQISMENAECLDEPPVVENAEPVVKNRSHGNAIWYKCRKNYKKVKEGMVACKHGNWSGQIPVCVKRSETSCLADPPEVLNADPVIKRRNHGAVIWYKCHSWHVKVKAGEVVCDMGIWKGQLPECNEAPRYGSHGLQSQMRHGARFLRPSF